MSLVSAGFPEDAVLEMPLDKVALYAKGVRRQNAYRRSESFYDLVSAIGISFSGKGLDEYAKQIGADDG